MSTQRWRHAPATLWRRTTGGAVVLPDRAEAPVTLTGAAALLWDLLDEPTTAEEAVALLADACDVPRTEVSAGLTPVLEHLRELGALEPA